MTEIDVEVQELFVPLSELGGQEPHKPDAAFLVGRLYNDLDRGIFITRMYGGRVHGAATLAAGATSGDFWTIEELFLLKIPGYHQPIVWTSEGLRVAYQRRVSPRVGTTNVSSLS
ncbi:hypothetical protein ACIRRA_42740 [Nocardia sp. NPDC101769]|uniref:hypothetical protein n=1 Tax=Nocardia sp. NPDC101769 TaxID=3364333 RepID=UPI0037FD96B4